jgi:hypothetical protein
MNKSDATAAINKFIFGVRRKISIVAVKPSTGAGHWSGN